MKTKPFLLSALTTVVLTVSLPAIAAPKWLMVAGNQVGTFFELDLNSVRLVEKHTYQYRHRLFSQEKPLEKRYAYGYDRVDCTNNLMTMIFRRSGPKGDGRMHELGWSEIQSGERSPRAEMLRAICTYAQKNSIPKLESDWDKKPESYTRYSDR